MTDSWRSARGERGRQAGDPAAENEQVCVGAHADIARLAAEGGMCAISLAGAAGSSRVKR